MNSHINFNWINEKIFQLFSLNGNVWSSFRNLRIGLGFDLFWYMTSKTAHIIKSKNLIGQYSYYSMQEGLHMYCVCKVRRVKFK